MVIARGWCPEPYESIHDKIEDRCELISQVANEVGMHIDKVSYTKRSGMNVRLVGENMLVSYDQVQAIIVRRLYELGYYMRMSLGSNRNGRAEIIYCVAKRQNINRSLWGHRPGNGHPDYVTPAKARRLGWIK